MSQVAMKKKSLEESVRGHSSGIIESERRIEVVGEDKFGELLEKYREFSKGTLEFAKITEVLTPEDLNLFLQMIPFVSGESIEDRDTSNFFTSKLLNNSYNAGHNNFVLDFTNQGLSGCGHRLFASKENPLKLMVYGHTIASGQNAENVHFEFNGNDTGWCGYQSVDSKYRIMGNVGYLLGGYSTNCYFLVKGNSGNNCFGFSEGSTLVLEGAVGDNCGTSSKSSTFKTTREENLPKLLDSVVKKIEERPSGNKIIFVNKDGSEEMVRDYS